jgi:hypothetical protein
MQFIRELAVMHGPSTARDGLRAAVLACICCGLPACGSSDTSSGQAPASMTPASSSTPAAGTGSTSATPASSSSGGSGAKPPAAASGASAAAGSGGRSTTTTTTTTPATGSGGSGGAISGAAGAAGSIHATGGIGAAASAGTSAAGMSGASAGAGGMMGGAVADDRTIIPDSSWTCGMPDGIPGIASDKMLFQIDMTVGEVHDIGETQYGHRHQIDITGGSIKGDKLTGTLMSRGLDYQLTLSNGVVEDEQINIISAGSSSIYMRNCGVSPGAGTNVRVVLDFEAPNGTNVEFLNTGKYIGIREFDADKKTLSVRVYEPAAASNGDPVKVIEPDDGAPDQTWDCKKPAGTPGAVVYMESVGIGGGSVAVGDSKRGTRNIIPITGGTTSGRVPGTVLNGGADFQILANGTFHDLDARYTIKATEGDLIVVRNCGLIGGLVPVFETKKDGKYAWLNANTWLSSDPGLGVGVVNLTIYEGGQ